MKMTERIRKLREQSLNAENPTRLQIPHPGQGITDY